MAQMNGDPTRGGDTARQPGRLPEGVPQAAGDLALTAFGGGDRQNGRGNESNPEPDTRPLAPGETWADRQTPAAAAAVKPTRQQVSGNITRSRGEPPSEEDLDAIMRAVDNGTWMGA